MSPWSVCFIDGTMLIGAFVASLWTLYYQYSLNKIWDLYLQGHAPASPTTSALTPPAAPPPPPQ